MLTHCVAILIHALTH